MPEQNEHASLLGSEHEPNGILFVLFIPSKDKDGNPLPRGEDQQMWANAAGDLLTKLFNGSTQMPPAKGKWLNDETNEIITEEIVLVHSYAHVDRANDESRLKSLAEFLHRMGKNTKQGEIAVVIGDVFHRIRSFKLAK